MININPNKRKQDLNTAENIDYNKSFTKIRFQSNLKSNLFIY